MFLIYKYNYIVGKECIRIFLSELFVMYILCL